MDRRGLRISLRLGATYDLLLAVAILAAGRPLHRVLDLPLPHPYYFFMLATLPLILLPALYLAASRASDCEPFRGPVLWARFGGGGMVILLTLIEAPPGAGLFLAIGAADLVWGAAHSFLWRR